MKLFYLVLTLFLFNYSHSLQAKDDKRVWISIGADAVNYIEMQDPRPIDIARLSSDILTKISADDVVIVSIPESQVDGLSKLMHEDFNRCSGYFFHQNLDAALAFNKNHNELKSTKSFAYSINNSAAVTSLLSQLSSANLMSTITNLSFFYNRYYQSQSGIDSTASILNDWQSIAANRTDINIEYYQHANWAQPSVIATIEGTLLPEEIVVLGGHLDSINGNNTTNGRAPGADDNASGIAVLTEVLSMIVGSDFRPARTVKLMGYAAEEVGLRGSQDIAGSYDIDNKNVIGVAQFDMTGYKGSNPQDIVFITDYTNELQTEFMSDLLNNYFPQVSYGFDICGYACSDHAAWTNYGVPTSFPFESYFRDSNPTIHTPNDIDFDINHVMIFTRLAAAYVAELAKGGVGTSQPNAALGLTASDIVVDGGENVILSIERTGDSSSSVSIDYATVNQTAVAGSDYTPVSGTLNWGAGDDANKNITISTNTVSTNKTFSLELSNPQGNSIITARGSIEISINSNNPDPAPDNKSGGGLFNPLIILLLFLFRKTNLWVRGAYP